MPGSLQASEPVVNLKGICSYSVEIVMMQN